MRAVYGFLVACALLIPRPGFAQAAAQPADPVSGPPRFWVDVNVVGAGAEETNDRRFTGLFIKFGEQGQIVATYPRPHGQVVVPVDVSGGIFLSKRWAIGAGYSNRTSSSDVAELRLTVPHPTMLNAPGIGTGSTSELERTESALHIFGTLVLLQKAKFEWRLSGGPSFFHYTADMVQSVSYTQEAEPSVPGNLIRVTGATDTTVAGNGLGAHASSDVAFFLSRQFAITGVARFSSALVTLTREPLSLVQQDLRVGSMSVLVGVRFHFNR